MHRNTQLLVLACVILAGLLLGRLFLQPDEKKLLATVPAENTGEPTKTTLSAPVLSAPTVEKQQATTPNASQNSSGPVNLWTASSNNFDIDIPAAQSDVEGAVLLEYDTKGLRGLLRGDGLLIGVPQQNTEYALTIEKVVNHPSGIKVIQARQSDNVRLILTLGQKNTFANLATLAGNFELVGNASAGWLMPAENMDPDIDPSIPDYVIPSKAQARLQNPAPRQNLN